MKNVTILTAIGLLWASLSGIAQSLTAQPGQSGIYLSFGRQMPKTFRYRVERSPAGRNTWEPLTEVVFPRVADEFMGRLNEAIAQLPPSHLHKSDPDLTNQRFQVLKRSATIDSLQSLMRMPPYQIAAGIGFWDNRVLPNTGYDYRLSQVSADGQRTAPTTVQNVQFPGRFSDVRLRIDTVHTTGAAVSLECEVVSGPAPDVLHLYRAYYLRGEYEEVVASYFPISSKNGRIRYRVVDAGVTDKLSYSYYIVPGDYLGNRGNQSDVQNVYNARPNEVTFMPRQFRVTSATAKRALRLSWRVMPSREITSVDVYRGNDFDKTFARIGSVNAKDTVFFDYQVEPVRTYFYTLIVNTAYGKTYPSARVPGLLVGNETNYSRPTGFRGTRQGQRLTFTWQRPSGSVYGYYLYRAKNYTDKPELARPIIVSSDSIVTVTDSLPSQPSDYWIYSVASVNTSYNISAPSERVTFAGKATVRPPAEVTVQLRDNRARIIWTNMNQQKQQTYGFWVYRREIATDNKSGNWQPLTREPLKPETNFFADQSIEPGKQYAYTVRTVGPADQLSSYSMEARCIVPETFPSAVRNIKVLQTGKSVLVQWDKPFDSTVEQFVVYRAEAGQTFQRLKEVARTATEFSDANPLGKRTYYYRIVSEDRRKQQSRNPDTVGIYIE